MSDLNVEGLHVSFDQREVLRNTRLKIKAGSLSALVGASGSGKTTLLRAIAGLQDWQEGAIFWRGKPVAKPTQQLIAGSRHVTLVTQNFDLIPMLSAFEHICQGAAVWGEEEKARTANKLLTAFGLSHVAHRPVRTLSGGQQQRVSIARSLASNANLFLFDEAFSQLDLATRAHAMMATKNYLLANQKTALFVVHDVMDAFFLADQLFVLHKGRIVQSGIPSWVYLHPKSMAVGRLFGILNTIPPEVAQALFPNIKFHLLRGKAVFRPHQINLADLALPYHIKQAVEMPRGRLLQVVAADACFWIEELTANANQ